MATRQSASKPLPSPRDATALPLGQASAAAAILLANLRLLDLHLLPDWPDISHHTFSALGAGVQGQKRRIQSAEWLLFHLFSLWNPQDAANKLKPFFPPIDQIHSINLRAALLRALEQAKKNGVLARDALVRKTILDECKGQRFEEILASLSTAVLKKHIASEAKPNSYAAAIALKLAFDHNATPDSTQELSALVLAHKVSLRRFLQHKSLMRSRYSQFAGLLHDKKSQHHLQVATLQAAKQSCTTEEALSTADKEEMHRILRHNWTGDERWIKTLIHGDDGSSCTTLSLPFEKVWQEVQRGRLLQLQQDECGLLEQLESRAAAQQQRLEKLTALCSNDPDSPSSSLAYSQQQPPRISKGKGLDFGQHLNLQIEAATAYASTNADIQPLLQADEQLYHKLGSELARIKSQGAELPEFLARQKPQCANHHDAALSKPQQSTKQDQDAPLPSPYLTDTTLDQYSANATLQPYHQDFSETDALDPIPPAAKHREKALVDCSNSTRHIDSTLTRKFRPNVSVQDEENASQRALSDDVMVGQSAQPMSDAWPPPIQQSVASRQSLSLAQRTRLSMSQTNNFPQQEAHQPQSSIQPGINDQVQEQAYPDTKPASTEDLLSRTRRSMAGSEKAKQKAQAERRNSLRRSRLPPRVDSTVCATVDEANEQSTLAEELMLEEDMEAVFRSRPKIKASPVTSPAKKYSND
ncbi:hypothetical protein CDD82_3788 [Ophiocordyceps australis]|uniref:HAUS augmin-like complex subunit 6 N-terminal domain-containing protein n=1 Tax=Ophiocordyceps australis TaxID=1399860 RepID=A0A2C5Z9Y4_9HYPO|nr:hypothetical protein CDD82_3788 [Ophiocordyceps australis]